jgi:hypothetical protein
MVRFVVLLACGSIAFAAEDPPIAVFGTTVVSSSGFRGLIYKIRHNTSHLPELRGKKPIGAIYTTTLNVPARSFTEGFPGLTDRFEWFDIEYQARIWIDRPGEYEWRITSDDGSRLYIDGQMVIDNDGLHIPQAETGSIELSTGVHSIRVSYFQGPRFHVALVLEVARPGDGFRIFDTNDFKPPPDANVPPEALAPPPEKE